MRYLAAEERDTPKSNRNAPVRLLSFFSADIAAALSTGRISPQIARTLQDGGVGLTVALIVLERIKVTPMPFAHTQLIHRTACLFCFCCRSVLPICPAISLRRWLAMISYAFFGLDAIADALQAPLANMPMIVHSTRRRALEIGILEMLGKKQLPPPMQLKRSVLT